MSCKLVMVNNPLGALLLMQFPHGEPFPLFLSSTDSPKETLYGKMVVLLEKKCLKNSHQLLSVLHSILVGAEKGMSTKMR